jgi:hypothetical protein
VASLPVGFRFRFRFRFSLLLVNLLNPQAPVNVTPWLRNGHLASVFGSLLRSTAGLSYDREMLPLVGLLCLN